MRPVTLFQVGMVEDPAVQAALREIELASQEVDIVLIAKNFTITGAYTNTRTLNVSTATLPDLLAFVATFIADLQKGGANRAN